MNPLVQNLHLEYFVEEVWRKGNDKTGKGKFHCSKEVKVGRGLGRRAVRENYRTSEVGEDWKRVRKMDVSRLLHLLLCPA